MAEQVRVVGLKSLSRDMGRISKELPKAMKRITKEAAQLIADETRATAPVKSGRLRGSVKVGATANGAYVATGGRLPYAKPIVFGWPRHNISPHGFPYEAVERGRPAYHEAVQAGLDELFRAGPPE